MPDLERLGRFSLVMGHTNTATTRKYTHLRPMHLVEPLEQLSGQIQIADVVMRPAKHQGADRKEGAGKKVRGS
jgi:hypothetical protein